MVNAITTVVGTISATVTACIAWSGWPHMAAFLQGLMSIIGMATPPTTIWPTWNWWRAALTSRDIRKDTGVVPLLRPWLPLPVGMGVPLVASGITHTTTMSPIVSMRERINRVPIVDETTPDSAMPDFVPTPVGARGVVRLAWTMWNTCAWSVTRCLQGIGMRRRSRAADRVACVSVTNAGQADVYCLTVPGLSAFAVGPSGVIVHNTRYVIQSGRARMKVRPLGTGGEKGGAQTGATDSGWMAQ